MFRFVSFISYPYHTFSQGPPKKETRPSQRVCDPEQVGQVSAQKKRKEIFFLEPRYPDHRDPGYDSDIVRLRCNFSTLSLGKIKNTISVPHTLNAPSGGDIPFHTVIPRCKKIICVGCSGGEEGREGERGVCVRYYITGINVSKHHNQFGTRPGLH